MKNLIPAIRMKLFFSLVLGLFYPLLITAIAHIFFPFKATGEFLTQGGKTIGAAWIAQKFEKPEYFWARPSAVDYNPLPSGGSNLGPTSAELKKTFEERRARLKATNPGETTEPPQDLLFASGSGLDPDISPAAAQYQVQRVAKARLMKIQDVQHLIAQASRTRQLGIFGEPTVNVLALNLSLDDVQGIDRAPLDVPPSLAKPVQDEVK